MSRIFDAEIEKMRHLMGYGLNEGASKESKPIVEYHAEGADGKTYGILRENNKFYIKVAPKKDTPVLAEDYDYIGGFMNKKENEYTTYAVASKQFDMKMKTLAESCGSKKIIEQFSKVEPAEWQINETKEMRDEINRINEISRRSKLIEEGKGNFTEKHTLPEAPAQNPSEKEVCSPYINVGVEVNPNKDIVHKKTDHSKAAPFDGRKGDDGKSGNPYVETDFYINDTGVAGKKGKDGKGLKEGRTVRLTENQVLAWSDSKDYMDKSKGTHVGKSNPFNNAVGCESNQCEADTDPIREAVYNSDDLNNPNPGTSDPMDGVSPYEEEVNECGNQNSNNPGNLGNPGNIMEEVDPEDVAGMPDGEDTIEIDVDDSDMPEDEWNSLVSNDEAYAQEGNEVPFPEVEPTDQDLSDINKELPDIFGSDYDYQEGRDESYYGGDVLDVNDDFFPNESYSRRRGGERIYEVVLNDFGEHPAFGKEPMTTPPSKLSDKYGKDWNDDSAKGDEPFAKQIGSGDPFTEKITDMITDAVVNMVSKKKA